MSLRELMPLIMVMQSMTINGVPPVINGTNGINAINAINGLFSPLSLMELMALMPLMPLMNWSSHVINGSIGIYAFNVNDKEFR